MLVLVLFVVVQVFLSVALSLSLPLTPASHVHQSFLTRDHPSQPFSTQSLHSVIRQSNCVLSPADIVSLFIVSGFAAQSFLVLVLKTCSRARSASSGFSRQVTSPLQEQIGHMQNSSALYARVSCKIPNIY